MIVTIDGPAGSGKSSAARALAETLGFTFLDTGAMYRAVAWKALMERIDVEREEEVISIAQHLSLNFMGNEIVADGRNIASEIRTEAVTEAASKVAIIPQLRELLVQKQREFAEGSSVVTEGRDQGTVVFPRADCKFFLTASVDVRATRRFRELQSSGVAVDYDELIKQIHERDARDEQRSIAPLKPADDAEVIDTSDMLEEEVVRYLSVKVRAKMAPQSLA